MGISFHRSLHAPPNCLTPLSLGSIGVEKAVEYLNSEPASKLLKQLAMLDSKLNDEISGLNFWSNSAFIIRSRCKGIFPEGIELEVECDMKGKPANRRVIAPFPFPVYDESKLKLCLIDLATSCERITDTADIASLPFGDDCNMPVDFKFNNVPHAPWVRSYLYSRATQAVLRAINDETIPSHNKSRMQLRVNYPEVNPAYDTYRLGTLLEMVREMVLALTDEGKKVRVCVQQALGEGIFVGMPLALSSMRVVLEKMDWGSGLTTEQKWNQGDDLTPRSEALIRLGTIGADQVADDDDVFIIICPQNVIGGLIIDSLEEMVKKASVMGKPLLLINPLLADRPSSNNVMQIRGRSERRAFQDSFIDIYALRLLYPSNGGYMYPIRGMISKKGWREPWCCYSREDSERGQEVYKLIAAFPPNTPPDPNLISSVFTR